MIDETIYQKQVYNRIGEIKSWVEQGLPQKTIIERLGVTKDYWYRARKEKPELQKIYAVKMPDKIEVPEGYLDNYIALAAAIVKTAMEEYAEAYHYQLRHKDCFKKNNATRSVDKIIAKIERFFNSDFFDAITLSAVDPQDVILAAKKMGENFVSRQYSKGGRQGNYE